MRHDWKFSYKVSAVLGAAQTKIAHHESRFDFWLVKKSEVMARIKESGIDVKESLAGKEYSNIARGLGARVVIDATMQQDLNECTNKISEHNLHKGEYQSWAYVLANQPQDATLELDYADYLFFFGK